MPLKDSVALSVCLCEIACVNESRQSVEQTSDQSAPLLAMVVWRKTDVARMMIIVVCVGCDDNDDDFCPCVVCL